MDRNLTDHPFDRVGNVALRKESVDRNALADSGYCGCNVALRKESVDRNQTSPPT